MANEFLERLKNRIAESRTKQSVSEWVCENTSLPSGEKFNFKDHAFQKEILNDMSDNLCVIKTAQVGLSEISIRKSIAFMAQHPGTSVLYTYPDLNMKKRNAQTRVMPIFDNDFPVAKGDHVIRNSDIMQLGNSFLYMAANTEGDATSTSISMIINDELDLSNQEIIALFASRMQHSKYKIRQMFSTPTFDSYGISAEFAISNQKEFLVKCPSCGKWQLPEFDRKWVKIPGLSDDVDNLIEDLNTDTVSTLDLTEAYVCCEKCGNRLELGDDSQREWVAKFPERINNVGYRVNCFTSNLLPIPYIVKQLADYRRRDQMRRAYNVLLGLPYSNKSSRLEPGDIEQCFVDSRIPSIDEKKPVFAGIDIGSTCHITLSTGESDIIRFEIVPFEHLLERFKELDSMYNIVCGLVDRHPQISLANALRDQTEKRIMPVVYGDNKAVEPHVDSDGTVDYYRIFRTGGLDYVRDLVNVHKLNMYGYTTMKSIILTQLRDMFRDDGLENDAQPRWRKLTGNDHFFHSINYSLYARKVYEYQNSSTAVDDRVCVDLVGSQKSLYIPNILEYRENKVKHKGW